MKRYATTYQDGDHRMAAEIDALNYPHALTLAKANGHEVCGELLQEIDARTGEVTWDADQPTVDSGALS